MTDERDWQAVENRTVRLPATGEGFEVTHHEVVTHETPVGESAVDSATTEQEAAPGPGAPAQPAPAQQAPAQPGGVAFAGYPDPAEADGSAHDTDPAAGAPASDDASPRRRFPRALVGGTALAAGVVTVVAHIVAVAVASGGAWQLGTVWGFVSIWASVIGVLLGLVAVSFGWGRGFGAIALVISVFGNPFLLLQLLNFFGGT